MPRLLKSIGLISAVLIFFSTIVFAADESITITTYYPSPYGSYRELRAQRIAIGDNYINGSLYCWEGICTNTIDANADLVVEGKVGIGTASPGTSKLKVTGTIESTSGGFKFPDGSVQDKAATSILYSKTSSTRSIGTTYQNTGSRPIIVTVQAWISTPQSDSSGYIELKTGSSNPPTITEFNAGAGAQSGYTATWTFVVPPGYFYLVRAVNTGTGWFNNGVSYWTETTI